MDILHKKLSQIGDTIYFLTSSVEEPYYWLRFKGEIMEISLTDDVITYRIKLIEILEPISIIKTLICKHHFRIRSIKKKQKPFLDYLIKTKLNINENEIIPTILNQMKTKWFDVSIMTTFLNENEMNEKLDVINKHNIDVLMKRIEFLSHRNIEL